MTQRQRRYAITLCVFWVVVSVTSWVATLAQTNRHPYAVAATTVQTVVVGLAVAGFVLLAAQRYPVAVVAINGLFALSQVLSTFSSLYWNEGRRGQFNVVLSHLDSIYFALGTLTTAGTGHIVALREAPILLQTLQMGVCFGLVAFGVAILIGRVAGR